MTDEERELIDVLRQRTATIQASAHALDKATKKRLCLPIGVANFLRHTSQAIAECESVVQTFAGRIDPSKEALQQIASRLREIHRSLDDLILPAAIDRSVPPTAAERPPYPRSGSMP
jgi:hypothetical protein